MTRHLVAEDEWSRTYEVRDDAGNVVGYDVESKQGSQPCPTCGGSGQMP